MISNINSPFNTETVTLASFMPVGLHIYTPESDTSTSGIRNILVVTGPMVVETVTLLEPSNFTI